jgi:hypothetical protein
MRCTGASLIDDIQVVKEAAGTRLSPYGALRLAATRLDKPADVIISRGLGGVGPQNRLSRDTGRAQAD